MVAGASSPAVASPKHSLWWWLSPLAVAVTSTMVLHWAIRAFRNANRENLPDGYRVQDWTSNWLMQSLGLEELVPEGLNALVFNHIYPPMLDAIRLALAQGFVYFGGEGNAVDVDFGLYAVFAVCFGVVNALLFLWVRDLTASNAWALGVTVVWAMSPGYIMVMTLLDPSALSMTFISSTLFFLYIFLRRRKMYWAAAFFASFLLASLARSVTQPHVLVILIAALFAFWYMSQDRSRLWLVLSGLLVALMFVIPVKQYLLFGTTDTTSFGGYHRVGMLWIAPGSVPQSVPESVFEDYETYKAARDSAEDPSALAGKSPAEIREAQANFARAGEVWQERSAAYPGVDFETVHRYPDRIEENALKFSSRYNTREQVLDNYRLSAAANAFLIANPGESVHRLSKSLTITVPELLRPTSEYTQNYFVEKLPWRNAWNWLFSGWFYLFLIGASATVIGWSRGWRGIGRLFVTYGWFVVFYGLLALPILLSNRFRPGEEDLGPIWTDAIRQKLFLEMPIWALMGYALWLVASRTGRARWADRRRGLPDKASS